MVDTYLALSGVLQYMHFLVLYCNIFTCLIHSLEMLIGLALAQKKVFEQTFRTTSEAPRSLVFGLQPCLNPKENAKIHGPLNPTPPHEVQIPSPNS